MNNMSRRSLLSRAAVGFTSIGLFSAASSISEGQFVWKASEWKHAEFRKLLKDPARIKQVYDVVQILSCHTALEEQVRVLISHCNLSQSPEDMVKDMLAHALPGVPLVASMVAAIALRQAEGHYTYITV
jgi:hypothetical protein